MLDVESTYKKKEQRIKEGVVVKGKRLDKAVVEERCVVIKGINFF